jgi:hypothetical protein
MVGYIIVVPITQVDFPECHLPSEHLVKMSALAMSLSTRVDCSSETQRSQLLGDVSHVVVEITTDDYRSVGILLDDVPRNFCHSHGPLPQALLFSGLEIAVQNLDILVTEL